MRHLSKKKINDTVGVVLIHDLLRNVTGVRRKLPVTQEHRRFSLSIVKNTIRNVSIVSCVVSSYLRGGG
jgi:ppGpp synthetase/RelA/SpoT-type nucleotidyltranferase